MKVDPGAPVLTSLARGAPSISFTGGGDFASKLTLGQIIKGRVLRSYEGGRYAIDFGGQQKIVDSAIPLRPDEVIVGRVIGLGEKVELQKIATHFAGDQTTAASAATLTPAAQGAIPADTLGGAFARIQTEVSPAELAVLQRAVGNAAAPETMALSGLVLSRLGIPLTPDVLRAVFDAVRADKRAPMFALPEKAIELVTAPAAAALTQAAAAGGVMARATPALDAAGSNDAPSDASAKVALPGLLADLLDQARDTARNAADDNAGGGPRDDARRSYKADDVARQVLNVQSGGAIAHRVGTLPIVVDGQLFELDVALFDQPPERGAGDGGTAAPAQALRHRQLVFAVTTERLGRVEVRATTAGTHMRVEVNTENRDSSQALARYAARLSTDLEAAGWEIDELAYRTVLPAGSGMVPKTLLEHLSAPGSVSRLA